MDIRYKGIAKIQHDSDKSYEIISWHKYGIAGDIKFQVEFRDPSGYLRASRGNSFKDMTDFDSFVEMLELASHQNTVEIIK